MAALKVLQLSPVCLQSLCLKLRLSCNDQKQILLARIPGPDVGTQSIDELSLLCILPR